MLATQKKSGLPVDLSGRAINVREMSRSLSIDHSYLCKILLGKRQPKLDLAIRIADLLDMELSELVQAIQARKNLAG